MFFLIKNQAYSSQLQQTSILLRGYYIIQNYPMHGSELLLDRYLRQQYDTDLKNICVKLLLNLSFYKDNAGNSILLFKEQKYDKLARLITYGNGAIPGSNILKVALAEV